MDGHVVPRAVGDGGARGAGACAQSPGSAEAAAMEQLARVAAATAGDAAQGSGGGGSCGAVRGGQSTSGAAASATSSAAYGSAAAGGVPQESDRSQVRRPPFAWIRPSELTCSTPRDARSGLGSGQWLGAPVLYRVVSVADALVDGACRYIEHRLACVRSRHLMPLVAAGVLTPPDDAARLLGCAAPAHGSAAAAMPLGAADCARPLTRILLLFLCSLSHTHSLYDVVRNRVKSMPLSITARADLMRAVAEMLADLAAHEQTLSLGPAADTPLGHYHLTSSNIFVDRHWRIESAGYGFGVDPLLQRLEPATAYWLSPELLWALSDPALSAPCAWPGSLSQEVLARADLYAFAMLLHELWIGRTPLKAHFEKVLPSHDPSRRLSMFVGELERGYRPSFSAEEPRELLDICDACWTLPAATCVRQVNRDIFDLFLLLYIEDEAARSIWTSVAPRQDVASTSDLVDAFLQRFHGSGDNDEHQRKCFQSLVDSVAAQRDDSITSCTVHRISVQQFANVLEWFGPIRSEFLADMCEMLSKPWFHGLISREEAERRVSAHHPGTYLVRLSESDPGAFAITTLGRRENVKHYRIMHRAGLGFLIAKYECASVDEIVFKFQKDLYLRHPCPGSEFAPLFQVHMPTNTDPLRTRYTEFFEDEELVDCAETTR